MIIHFVLLFLKINANISKVFDLTGIKINSEPGIDSAQSDRRGFVGCEIFRNIAVQAQKQNQSERLI